MFGLVKTICKNAMKLDSDKILKKVFSDSELKTFVLDLNRIDQLYDKGVTADDKYLGNYSAVTIEGTKNFKGKEEKGQRYDHITLKDTGDFYDSFRLKTESSDFIIRADTEKPDVDLMTYGKILGLDNESKTKLIEHIKIPVREMVLSQIAK